MYAYFVQVIQFQVALVDDLKLKCKICLIAKYDKERNLHTRRCCTLIRTQSPGFKPQTAHKISKFNVPVKYSEN